jgi:hypothetical protein
MTHLSGGGVGGNAQPVAGKKASRLEPLTLVCVTYNGRCMARGSHSLQRKINS